MPGMWWLGGHLGAAVSALVDGQLDEESAERAWAHVAGCASCRRLVEREGWVKRRLAEMAGAAPDVPPPPSDLLGSLYDLEPVAADRAGAPHPSAQAAWDAVEQIERRHRPRRRAGLAVAGVGSVSAAVLGLSTLGAAAGSITASKKTTTARARAVAHGFATGSTVTISGATPAAFNGNYTVTMIDDNNFTYPLATAQGDATGGITASTGTATGVERDNLINWVRGADNFEDENADGSNTDIRASIHGDVLHSRPAVVNYNRFGNDDDIYVYYGSNDGIFRSVKGGKNQSDASEPHPGQEVWGFIPEEHFPDLQRLRNNEPIISSANKKPYFADGTIIVHTQDNNADGKIDITDDDDANPDIAHLYITMRRGGRLIYALDVSDPMDPKLLWKKTFTDLGFAELGYTWSAPTVTRLAANGGEPVLIFGAGYDPAVEDVTPSAITAVDSTSVSAGAANYVRSMGRGIYVLDAATGAERWRFDTDGPVHGRDRGRFAIHADGRTEDKDA